MKKIVFAAAMLCCSLLATAQEDSAVKKVEYPKGYSAQIDAVYSEINGWKGREDIYYNPTAAQPTPVVFNIHGGGWNHGTKESQTGFGSFFKMGYAVVNIEYRMTGTATAPAAAEDVRAAILYVVQHAKELNIDAQKLVIMGGSAGGHLALLAGFLQNDNRFDGAYKKVTNYKIAAIVDKYGPADLTAANFAKYKSLVNWLGANAEDAKFRQSLSPVTYITKNSPPVIIVHGDADPTVPYQQSVDLKKKLDEAGVKNEMITVPGGVHGKFPAEENRRISKAITDFLTGLGLTAR
jgi:acetyl esterase/lipase